MKHRQVIDRRARPRTGALVARGCVIASLVAWSTTADAYMGYPGVVDAWLGKDGFVEMNDPPMGCQLCHVDPQGGTVELKPFANDLVARYGLPKTAEQDAALMGILGELEAANPALFKDMQQGIDPNTDPALTAQALPQPEYGCSAGTVDSQDRPPWLAILVALAALARRSRRGPQDGAAQKVPRRTAPPPPGTGAGDTPTSARPGRFT